MDPFNVQLAPGVPADDFRSFEQLGMVQQPAQATVEVPAITTDGEKTYFELQPVQRTAQVPETTNGGPMNPPAQPLAPKGPVVSEGEEQAKPKRIRSRYEIPPRDPNHPQRTRIAKKEFVIDYSTRRAKKGDGEDTETKSKKKLKKPRRKVTKSSGTQENVAENSHGHHTAPPEDEDETTPPNAENQITEPSVDRIRDGPRFGDFVPEVLENRTRSARLSSSGAAPQPPPPARRQRAPKRKRPAQEGKQRGRPRRQMEASNQLDAEDGQEQAEKDDHGALHPPPSQPLGVVVARLGGPEGIILIPRDKNMGPVSANENRPMEQRLGGNAENAPNNDQNAQEPAPPQRNRNQEEDSHDDELADAPYDDENAQYDPRLDFEHHLQPENQVVEQPVVPEPAPPVQVAENQISGNGVARNEEKHPSRAFRYRDPHLEEEAEDDYDFADAETRNLAAGNQLFAQFLGPVAGHEPSGALAVSQRQQAENRLMEQPPHVQAPAPPRQQNANLVVPSHLEEANDEDNELADRIQAPAPPSQQNAKQVKLEPNVDIKVEVEEHGLFDMDLQALGNVVGEVGEMDEEDVILEDVPPRNMDDDDIIVVLDQSVPPDRKLADAPKMAMPGKLRTDPEEFVKFNAPFEVSQAVKIKIWNPSNRRIAFKLIAVASDRLEFDPPFGIVEAKGGRVYVKIETKPFKFRQGFSERIIIESMNGPREGDVEPDYFMDDGMKRLKKLTVQYNR